MKTIRDNAMAYLNRELREAQSALTRAAQKPNVKQEELENIKRKIDAITWVLSLVSKEA